MKNCSDFQAAEFCPKGCKYMKLEVHEIDLYSDSDLVEKVVNIECQYEDVCRAAVERTMLCLPEATEELAELHAQLEATNIRLQEVSDSLAFVSAEYSTLQDDAVSWRDSEQQLNEMLYMTYAEWNSATRKTYNAIVKDDAFAKHSFSELYHQRAALLSIICKYAPENVCVWKAKKHADGTMYDGMFLLGITTKAGDATFHIEEAYWDLFQIPDLCSAPVYDGHTAKQAITRLLLGF